MGSKRIQKIPVKYRKEVEKDLEKLSVLLAKRRKELKLTQEQLAEELDVSPITIQHIEQGRRFPSLPTLFYMLKLLKADFEIS